MENGIPSNTEAASLSDFKASILRDGIEAAASTHLMDRIPFVFNNDWELYRTWKRKLAKLIEVDPLNITIIGSGGIGFSLNPHKDFRPFSDKSDIDVAVVSEYHFAIAWRALRALKLPDVRTFKDREAVKEHRTNYIYWGGHRDGQSTPLLALRAALDRSGRFNDRRATYGGERN